MSNQFNLDTPFDAPEVSATCQTLLEASDAQPKLYAWRPKGHGPVSFFVVAHSSLEAGELIGEYIAKNEVIYDAKCDIHYFLDAEGFGTDGYELEIAEVGQVLINAND